MHKKLTSRIFSFLLSVSFTGGVFAANERTPSELGGSVRNDTSKPLSQLIQQRQIEARKYGINTIEQDYEIPNILEIDPSLTEQKFNARQASPSGTVNGSSGLASPPVLISVDGFTAADDTTIFGGIPIPPDTNGDVGIDFYIQYVNLGWKIMNKNDGSVAAGPFIGNVFWDGFGGSCDTDNAGDPIVLFDKLANRWIFSQFTSSGNPDGRQCFAISTTVDPLGPYHRYEFVFPGEFNDYPHIGIWDDDSGDRSGYYFVTHEFSDVGGPSQAFEQASYSVVERTEMLAGNPAQFVRFQDTTFLGAPSFGAQPAHLESIDLPPAGTCNPFVMGRPDQNGYQLVDFCVDWDIAANSTLSAANIVDAGESWNPGPGGVAQPNTAMALDTLAGFGRILYRATYRSYPDDSPHENTMVISFPVDVGGGQAGIRWAQINFSPVGSVVDGVTGDLIFKNGFDGSLPVPEVIPVVVNQGEYAPDTTDRWMSGISIDRDGNIGVAYTAANSVDGVFPGVRFTTRTPSDPVNTLRDEEICVDGGGSQTGGTRWGDYSSLSVDPVDECTFWASVEYQLTTATRNWSNRVCSFRVEGCGGPSVFFDETVEDTIEVCSATTDLVSYDYGLIDLNGFTETSILSISNEPLGSSVSFPGGATINTYPNSDIFEVSGLQGLASGDFTMTLTSTSTSITRNKDYHMSVSSAATNVATTLLTPADIAVDAELLSEFTWTAVAGALSYSLEVATDVGFTNIVLTTETTGTSYTATESFDINTTFYWRVTGLNNCGAGVASTVFSFTTGSFVTGTAAECTGGTTANIVFFDDIEGDISDWTVPAAPIGTNTWTQSGARAFAGTSWFAQDLPVSSDQYLISPPIVLPAIAESPISLSYWNFQNMEANTGLGTDACWDGGLLEISTDAGATFTQISAVDILADEYNGSIFVQAPSPISGLDAWCADDAVAASGEQTDFAVIDLDAFAGQTVQFRFRVGTDSAVGDEGWYLDNVTVQSCQ